MDKRLFMTTDCVGGVWRYSVDLAGLLVARGWTVALATIGPKPAPDQAAEAKASGVRLLVTGAALDWAPDGATLLDDGRAELMGLASRFGADIVHLNQPAYGSPGWSAPTVAVIHSCIETWWRGVCGRPAPAEWGWHREAVANGLFAAACAAAPTRSFALEVESVYPGAGRVRALHNGSAIAFGARKGARDEVVFTAGRVWDEGKNFQVLDRAAETIRWPVCVAGALSPPAGGAPCKLENLFLSGPLDRSDMRKALAAAPIYVSTSLYEPFGLGVLEAARAGSALALSDIPVFRELWKDCAVFFDPHSPRSVAGAVNALIENPPLRLALAASAARRAQKFSLEQTARGMEEIYLSAMGADQRRMEAAS